MTDGPVSFHDGPYDEPGAAVDGAHALAREVARGNEVVARAAARAESDLRATARGFARCGMPSAEESLIDDACVGRAGRILGIERCRAIIREEFAAATAAADSRMAGIRAERPEVDVTPDGLAQVLALAGWSLAWDTTSRRVVARKGDGATGSTATPCRAIR